MSSSRFVKALPLPAAAVAAIAAPLLGSRPASAATTCAADPYNGVCVATTDATVKTTAARVAVQAPPKTANTTRYVAKGATVGVICQVVNSASRTAIAGGGWLPTATLNLTVGTAGSPPTIRPCGAASAVSTYNAA